MRSFHIYSVAQYIHPVLAGQTGIQDRIHLNLPLPLLQVYTLGTCLILYWELWLLCLLFAPFSFQRALDNLYLKLFNRCTRKKGGMFREWSHCCESPYWLMVIEKLKDAFKKYLRVNNESSTTLSKTITEYFYYTILIILSSISGCDNSDMSNCYKHSCLSLLIMKLIVLEK